MEEKSKNMLNILTDFHHAALLNSIIMLFEGRLGGQVYRPIGTEWFEEGYWAIFSHPATVQQYLGINGATPDGTPPLNDVIKTEDTVFYCKDIDSTKTNKAITLTGFMTMPIDIVIASIPEHIEPFKKLCSLHPNHPKLIHQIGNSWNIPNNSVQNVMASAICNNVPPDINYVQYHQEFPLDVFYPASFKPQKIINSFINCLNVVDNHKLDWELFLALEKLMPKWEFKSYGGQCRDGVIAGDKEIAQMMRETAFGFHCKSGGDGYGHIIHNLSRCGVPMIIRESDYIGKMAEPFIDDGVTCITVDGKTPEQIAAQIEAAYKAPFNFAAMRKELADRFKSLVDFDHEELILREFIDKLI